MNKIFLRNLLVLAFISSINAQPGTEPDTIFVSAGWNLIGSKFAGAVSDIVTSVPQGIIASPFYKYSPQGGYSASDTLEKSTGYWVKISNLEASGSIIISMPHILFICGHPTRRGLVWHGDKFYRTVQIGTQCWLKSNLDIGTMIDGSETQTNNGVIEKYCYGDDESNCDNYGGLYQWAEAMKYVTTEGAQGICPNGWHIPTWAEFLTLEYTVGLDGNSLKAVGQGSGLGAGTNTSGFSALLAGQQSYGSFVAMGNRAKFWSSTGFSDNAYFLDLYGSNSDIDVDLAEWNFYAFSVRCIKN